MPTATNMKEQIFFNTLPRRSLIVNLPVSKSHITNATTAIAPTAISTSVRELAILPIDEIMTHATPIMGQICFIFVGVLRLIFCCYATPASA